MAAIVAVTSTPQASGTYRAMSSGYSARNVSTFFRRAFLAVPCQYRQHRTCLSDHSGCLCRILATCDPKSKRLYMQNTGLLRSRAFDSTGARGGQSSRLPQFGHPFGCPGYALRQSPRAAGKITGETCRMVSDIRLARPKPLGRGLGDLAICQQKPGLLFGLVCESEAKI